jgi:YVTN family beta-propeller protein
VDAKDIYEVLTKRKTACLEGNVEGVCMKVKVWKLLVSLFNLIFVFSMAMIPMLTVHEVHAIGLIQTIYTGPGTSGLAYDSGKGEIFVPGLSGTGGYQVSVINDTSNTVVATVPLPANSYPSGAAYDSGNGYVYVPLSGYPSYASGSVAVISDRNNTVVANVSAGAYPIAAAYDSGNGYIYVTNLDSNTVSVISGTTLIDTVHNLRTSNSDPSGLAYDSGKGEIFVACGALVGGNGSVSVINDTSNTVVANVTFPMGSTPSGLAYDSGKGEIFVNDPDVYGEPEPTPTCWVISDSTNSVVANVTGVCDGEGIAYDSGKGLLFTEGPSPYYGWPNVYAITDSNNTIVADVNMNQNYAYTQSGLGPGPITYDSGNGRIYVGIENGVAIIVDTPNLVAPSVSASPVKVDQGQTSFLNSTAVTTGIAPYAYQWFTEAPGASSYSSIGGATSSNYSFVTSTSTATGNWSFILRVTDHTAAAVNSTAVTVTVSQAVPELQPFMFLPLFTIVTLIGAMILKKRLSIKK